MMRAIVKKSKAVMREFGGLRSDSALKKRLSNIAHLLAGNFGAALISFAAVMLAGRALGAENYGFLAIAAAFVQAVERLLSFQTWQPIIRYGAGLVDQEDKSDYKALIKFALFLDLSTAIAGWLFAVGAALFGRQVFGWSEESIAPTLIYATVLLFTLNGMPAGVLRLAGRFKLAAYVQSIMMSVRLVLVLIAFQLKWDLTAFSIIWAATHILALVLMLGAAGIELKRQACLDFMQQPFKNFSTRFPNIWRFSLITNFSLTIRSSPAQFDTLLVGAIAGPAGAGYYHIAKRFAKFAEKAGLQIQVVIFPEISKLLARGNLKEFKRVMLQSELMIAVICILAVAATFLLAGPVINFSAGREFDPAADILTAQIVAVALMLIGAAARSGLMALGKETAVLAISLAATAVFFAVSFLTLPAFGAIGASYGHIARGVVWLVCLWVTFIGAMRAVERHPELAKIVVTRKKDVDGGVGLGED
jgi:O-antigen/teichoic acid export membrane protein